MQIVGFIICISRTIARYRNGNKEFLRFSPPYKNTFYHLLVIFDNGCKFVYLYMKNSFLSFLARRNITVRKIQVIAIWFQTKLQKIIQWSEGILGKRYGSQNTFAFCGNVKGYTTIRCQYCCLQWHFVGLLPRLTFLEYKGRYQTTESLWSLQQERF